MKEFLDRLGPYDRVLLIGDTRQHKAVDAGKPFEQLQDAGMLTVQLDQIVRLKDPELLKAVEHLARNETHNQVPIREFVRTHSGERVLRLGDGLRLCEPCRCDADMLSSDGHARGGGDALMVSAVLPITNSMSRIVACRARWSIYGLLFFNDGRFMQAEGRNQFAMSPARLLRQ
jgi:hypothetical protein